MKKHKFSKKRVASLLLCASMASAAVGGALMAGNTNVVGSAAAPNTTEDFLIGSWISFYDPAIESYENQLKDMAESGVNWHPNPLSLAGHTAGGKSLTYSMTELNEMYKKLNSIIYTTSSFGSKLNEIKEPGVTVAPQNLNSLIDYSNKFIEDTDKKTTELRPLWKKGAAHVK